MIDETEPCYLRGFTLGELKYTEALREMRRITIQTLNIMISQMLISILVYCMKVFSNTGILKLITDSVIDLMYDHYNYSIAYYIYNTTCNSILSILEISLSMRGLLDIQRMSTRLVGLLGYCPIFIFVGNLIVFLVIHRLKLNFWQFKLGSKINLVKPFPQIIRPSYVGMSTSSKK